MGMWNGLKVVYFQKEEEMNYFCDVLYRYHKKVSLQFRKHEHWGRELYIHDRDVTVSQVIRALVDVFMAFRFRTFIERIIRDTYYYEDRVEIDRIVTLTDGVLRDPYFQAMLWKKFSSITEYIYFLLKTHIQTSSPIHYDSLITFCLHPLRSCLTEAVGFGIDEMKREEEYQNFVESIREYVRRQRAKTACVHVLQHDPFQFFSSSGHRYEPFELKRLMEDIPLYSFGLTTDEMNLAPAIALLPEQIYIYGDHPTEAKTVTLRNIFQERCSFISRNAFPFL